MSEETYNKIADLVTQRKVADQVEIGKEYKLLGVRWYAKGPFIREVVNTTNSKATRLFPVKVGDFIYNRLFAWKGSFGLISEKEAGCHVSGEFPLFECNPARLLPEYLFLYMSQSNIWTQIEIESTGSTTISRNRWKESNFLDLEIRIFPVTEQARIVDLISSVDDYIEALQQQLEAVKRSRNAVLHKLLNAGGDDWETTTIGDISDFISVRKSPEQLSSDSIYVGLEHLEPNNTSINNFNSVSKVTSSLTPFDVGDVLFGRLRPYLHKVAIAEMFGFCSPEILVLRANSKVLPQMLLLFCDADSTIKICVERSAGTRMPRTSTEDLASTEIKLPSIAEQIKLAELSSTFDTVISHIGIALEKSKILRSGLLSDLLSGTHEIPASYDKVIGAA